MAVYASEKEETDEKNHREIAVDNDDEIRGVTAYVAKDDGNSDEEILSDIAAEDDNNVIDNIVALISEDDSDDGTVITMTIETVTKKTSAISPRKTNSSFYLVLQDGNFLVGDTV